MVSRHFPCQDTSVVSMVSWEKPFTDYRDLYVKSEEICNVLDSRVLLSAKAVIDSFDEIRDDVHKLMIGEVYKSQSSTSTSKGHDANLVMKIEKKWNYEFSTSTSKGHDANLVMKIEKKWNYEVQVTDWLRDCIFKKLQPLGFIFDSTTKALAPVNEYVTSKADMLIYHGSKYARTTSALYLHANYPDGDVLTESNDIETSVDQQRITGCISEHKMNKATVDAENQCF